MSSNETSKLENFKKALKTQFKRSNVKSFLFFLILSSIIWITVQFAQQYTEVLKIPVLYENYPKDKMIADKGSKLDIRVQQTGFQLAWFRLFTPKLEIDLNQLPADSTDLKYNLLENHQELTKKLPFDMNKAEFLDRQILIPFQFKSQRQVPVIPQIKVQFAPGYSSEEKLKTIPDSVEISGPKAALDSINEIYTKEITKKNVSKTILEEVDLEIPVKSVSALPERVDAKLKVEKFTEKEIELPIEVINKPGNLDLTLYPETVYIKFKVSLARYHQIDEKDFEIIADYRTLNDGREFIIPKLKKKPESVQQIMISPRKIEYVIKK